MSVRASINIDKNEKKDMKRNVFIMLAIINAVIITAYARVNLNMLQNLQKRLRIWALKEKEHY